MDGATPTPAGPGPSHDQTGGGHPADLVGRNIDRVLSLEEKVIQTRSWAEAVSEALGGFVGTLSFVVIHLVAIAVWLVVNSGHLTVIRPFDPYPFGLLSTIASSEAVILSAFVLMKQNRMSRVGDRRDHLDLQVNLLAEQEASLIIQMLDRIGRKLGVDPDEQEEALLLSRTATLEHLVTELHRRLPDSHSDISEPPV